MEKFLALINNYFEKTAEEGSFAIVDGTLVGAKDRYLKGQYVRIMDSILNDGVYKIKDVGVNGELTIEELKEKDEEFSGVLVGLAIPSDFIGLTKRMEEFIKNKSLGIKSESVPNYSVSFDDREFIQAFEKELFPYRKLSSSRFGFLNHVKIYGK